MINGLRSEVERFARNHGLDPNTVMGLIQVESRENKFAFRPEPKFRWLWDNKLKQPFRKITAEELNSEVPPNDFYDIRGLSGMDAAHEWWGQAVSWGLMQVMGSVAREAGFKEVYLTQLVEVGYNLEYGCTMLESLNRWAKGDQDAMLAAYNGGKVGNGPEDSPKRNQSYADKVKAAAALVRKGREL